MRQLRRRLACLLTGHRPGTQFRGVYMGDGLILAATVCPRCQNLYDIFWSGDHFSFLSHFDN